MCHCRYHRKQTLKEWIHGQCSGSADSFSLTQMCWFRLGTFGFVLKNMSLHCSSMKGHEASKVQGITKLFWGDTTHWKVPCKICPPWTQCPPKMVLHRLILFSSWTFLLLPDHLQGSYVLPLHWFYPWRSSCLQQLVCCSSADSWVCSHSNVMHYAYFDCLLVRSSFICNPVNETTPTSLEEEEQILLAPSQ